tara:strand:- start:470 stop:619 length:150 start_codon:yes stop_codon:yes gene_type:complete
MSGFFFSKPGYSVFIFLISENTPNLVKELPKPSFIESIEGNLERVRFHD